MPDVHSYSVKHRSSAAQRKRRTTNSITHRPRHTRRTLVKKEDTKMKKQFFKFLPLMAAVLLATSCSKDDDNNAPENIKPQSGIPFSIRVNTGNSLKKLGYAKDTDPAKAGYYNITFTDEDKDKLEMKIYNGKDLLTTLYLTDVAKCEFTGTVNTVPDENAKLTAEITTGNDQTITYSDKSLEDLLKNCAHTFKTQNTFKYGTEKITLTDQNTYLAISMTPFCEHEIEINDNSYTVKNGRIWIVVPSGVAVTSKGLGNELDKKADAVEPGKIYTVARQYFSVAKGVMVYFSKGNLQCVTEGENKKWQFADHQYDYLGNANDLLGWNTWDGIGSEWKNLSGSGYKYLFETRTNASNKWGQGSIKVSEGKTVNGVIILPDDWTLPKECSFTGGASDWENKYDAVQWKAMEANGAVFLPAVGYRNNYGYFDDGRGYYWSSTKASESSAYRLNFYSLTNVRFSATEKTTGQSVRLVRPL